MVGAYDRNQFLRLPWEALVLRDLGPIKMIEWAWLNARRARRWRRHDDGDGRRWRARGIERFPVGFALRKDEGQRRHAGRDGSAQADHQPGTATALGATSAQVHGGRQEQGARRGVGQVHQAPPTSAGL